MPAEPADVLGYVLAQRGTVFVDVGALTLQQAILELAAGQTDGPARCLVHQLQMGAGAAWWSIND